MRAAIKLADHTAIASIVAIQFLISVLLVLAMLFLYGAAATSEQRGWGVLFGVAGIATTIALNTKSRSWLQPIVPSAARRVPALAWNALATCYLLNLHRTTEAIQSVGVYTTVATSYLAISTFILSAKTHQQQSNGKKLPE
jgi:hypothetical protein